MHSTKISICYYSLPLMQYKNIALTARADLPEKEEILTKIKKIVKESGADLYIDPMRCADIASLKNCKQYDSIKDVDLIIAVGGDGTILSVVREIEDYSIPILSIHHGTLGFLTEVDADEIDTILPVMLKSGGNIDERLLLKIEIEENGKRKKIGDVLNEAVVNQGGISRLIDLYTKINGKELTTFRSDGLIIATPTGSTAYSMAAGGAIIHPHLTSHVTLLTPINPHNFKQKPIVIPGDQEIEIEVLTKDNAYRTVEVNLTLDGQLHLPLQRGQKVLVSTNKENIKFLRRRSDIFYERLREKLGWAE